MEYNVAQLLMETTGATRRYDVLEEIDELDPELHPLGPLVGTLELMRTHSGVLVRGELSTAIQVMCNRCLFPIAMPVRFSLSESFRPSMEIQTGRVIRAQEFEGSDEELEDESLVIDGGHILDMTEVVRQNIWLALPMYPNCNWEGPLPCPNLAEDAEMPKPLSETDEGSDEEAEQAVDPRWSALLALQEGREEGK